MVLTQFSWNIPVLARQGLRHLLLVHIHVQCAILMGHGPLTRYVNLRVAHAPRMPGTFSPPPWASDSDMHHGTCMTHVPWCMPGSLTSGFLWVWWQGKRSRHSRCMRNPQFYVLVRGPCHLLTFTETFIRVPYHHACQDQSLVSIDIRVSNLLLFVKHRHTICSIFYSLYFTFHLPEQRDDISAILMFMGKRYTCAILKPGSCQDANFVVNSIQSSMDK